MLETGANIATIFLILQFMIIMIVVLAVSILMAVAALRMRRKVEQVMPTVQDKARQVSTATESVSHKVAEPFIRVEQSQARLSAMFRRAFAFAGSSEQSGAYHEKATEE